MESHNLQVKCNLSASITPKDLHELVSFYFSDQIISDNLILIFYTLMINTLTKPQCLCTYTYPWKGFFISTGHSA